MSEFSAQVQVNLTDISQVYNPAYLQNVVDQNGYTTTENSDQFTITGPGFEFHLNGSGFTYSGNLVTGGTISGADEEINNVQYFAHTGLNVAVSQANNAQSSGGEYALESLIFAGDDNIQTALSQNYNDLVLAGTGNDSVATGGGDDTIAGNQGKDVLLGNLGKDFIAGGQDDDFVVGGQDDDFLYGNLGNDVVYGNQGNDTVFAGQGNDTVFAGQGDDLILGNVGNDTLSGNLGADKFRFNQGDGADVVTDYSRSEGDLIDLQGLSHTVTQASDGSALINVFGGGTINLKGIAAASVNDSYFA